MRTASTTLRTISPSKVRHGQRLARPPLHHDVLCAALHGEIVHIMREWSALLIQNLQSGNSGEYHRVKVTRLPVGSTTRLTRCGCTRARRSG
jgi:hypothetical protein